MERENNPPMRWRQDRSQQGIVRATRLQYPSAPAIGERRPRQLTHDRSVETKRGRARTGEQFYEAPNFFSLRPAGHTPSLVATGRGTGALLAAGVALLVLLLTGLRFHNQSLQHPGDGLQALGIDPQRQPVVLVGDKLYWHDRAGNGTEIVVVEGADPILGMDFFSTGELLLRRGREQPAAGRGWQPPVPWSGPASERQGSLQRCRRNGSGCITIVAAPGTVDFQVERRSNAIVVARSDADRLEKLDYHGRVVASTSMELHAPVHLQFAEGLLYLTQSHSRKVSVLKPDDHDFGKLLEEILLPLPPTVEDQGQLFAGALLYHKRHWWTILQSVDDGDVDLYQYSPNWQFERSINLPPGARPGSLESWLDTTLVLDRAANHMYRLDDTGARKTDFSPAAVTAALARQRAERQRSRSLQFSVLLLLSGTTAVLLLVGTLQILQRRTYVAPVTGGEEELDIDSDKIEWLPPATGLPVRLRRLGYKLAGACSLALCGCLLLGSSSSAWLAISLLLVGTGGLYGALQQACNGYLGVLENRLIVVDHTNTYRIGRGPQIQYFNNYVMVDNVIVYLGNRRLARFSQTRLQQRFQPLFQTGIKVDRGIVGLRLIQHRHPLAMGGAGLLLACVGAALVLLLGS